MKHLEASGRVLLEAARSGRNLTLLVVALAAAIVLTSGPVLIFGLLSYGVLTMSYTLDPRLRRAIASADAERAARLPDRADLRDDALRCAVAAVERARDELERAFGDAPPWLCTQIASTRESARKLEHAAARLARHAEYIYEQLERGNIGAVRHELLLLGDARRRVADPGAAQAYETASELRRQQVVVLQQLAGAREQDLAALARIEASLQTARARVLRLHLLGDGTSPMEEMNSEIARMGEDLELSEQALAVLGDAST